MIRTLLFGLFCSIIVLLPPSAPAQSEMPSQPPAQELLHVPSLGLVDRLCTASYMTTEISKAKAAVEIWDWTMSGVFKSDGEDASVCLEKYKHPQYAILKAYFYLEAARLLAHQPSVSYETLEEAANLGRVATGALIQARLFDLKGDLLQAYQKASDLDTQTLQELKDTQPTI